jgi:hypothetical protein
MANVVMTSDVAPKQFLYILRNGVKTTRANLWNHFTQVNCGIVALIFGFSFSARVFVPGKPFQPSIMFAGNARGLP